MFHGDIRIVFKFHDTKPHACHQLESKITAISFVDNFLFVWQFGPLFMFSEIFQYDRFGTSGVK